MAAALKSFVANAVSGAEWFRDWLLAQRWFSGVLMPSLPRQVRWTLRRIYLAPLDAAERIAGLGAGKAPARSSNFTGAVNDFKASGEALRQRLIDQAGLTPHSHVLDIGCGLGRLGAALTNYLDADGRYEGVDIVRDDIGWSQANIASPHGNVRFTHADIYNKEYNPHGKQRACDFWFPFPNDSFDIIVLISVFTHMGTEDMDHYLSEISRMLMTCGICYATFYLLTPESMSSMKSGGSTYDFKYRFGNHLAVSKAVPELTTGYEAAFMAERYEIYGLAPELRPGTWYRGGGAGGQDLLIGRKSGHSSQ